MPQTSNMPKSATAVRRPRADSSALPVANLFSATVNSLKIVRR
ncbi:MAG: hypothetical protein RLZZ618_3664 [Pseudomonadota bacterium]